MNYEGENFDEDSDEDEGTGGILSEPYPSGAIPNQHAEQEDTTNRLRSLEEEVATMRQQLIIAEAKVALAEIMPSHGDNQHAGKTPILWIDSATFQASDSCCDSHHGTTQW
ncbi:unnamed protein product [Lactuca saligna]|uniref:Uncharacterized protein n=1 Tax=Lactuca saligna TaxID=75948 RepID=A0AA36EGF0_LACSI|nr:unnamed protein product [Lactuca saligna]